MKYITLNNGVKMPMLGFGVFQIPLDQTEKAVLEALKCGYRMIDTAQRYGNEAQVGSAIRKSGIPREEVFVTTKVYVGNNGYEATKNAIQDSLNTLGFDYIDLLLIHHPYNDIFGAWKAMVEAYKVGKLKAIGVSNFFNDRILDLSLWSGVTPMLNQIEMHPFRQRTKEIEFQTKMGIVMESWASLAQGKNNIFEHEVLKNIANKFDKTVPQILLRWLIQKNVVVIPKSVTPSRIAENINIFDFELSQSDVEAINAMDEDRTLFFMHDDPKGVQTIFDLKKEVK